MNNQLTSSKKLLGICNSVNIHSAKQLDVQNGREALAEYVRRLMEERNWSTYDVVRESGGLITSNGTVWNVANLRVKDVKEKTLRGLAKAFKVPDIEVFEVYYGKKKVGEDELEDDEEVAALFYKYKKLTEEDKKEIRRLISIVDREIDRLEEEKKKRAKKKR